MSQFAEVDERFEHELTGEDYKVVLGRLHTLLKPANYLEIGSRDGSSLALASCPSIAVDPVFTLIPSFLGEKPFCGLYRMGSDAFFSAFKPEAIFNRKVDLAFLDGLHLAEFLLRDFINTERSCRANSVIAMHDCIPLDAPMARRHESREGEVLSARYPYFWTGDVWKVVVALKKYRPALQLLLLDAYPTGLAVVTGLDPQSTVLSDNYYGIVRDFRSMTDTDLESYVRSAEVVKTTEFATYEDIARFAWL